MLEVALIVVSLSAQSLTAIDSNGQELARMVVSTGKPSTPTPMGAFEIGHQYPVTDLVGDDYHVRNVPNVQCLVGNGIAPNNYCLHPRPPYSGSLGVPRSRGCIRLANQDAKWLFDNTAVGTEVIIQS